MEVDDPVDGYVVLFGGCSAWSELSWSCGGFLGDTWEFSNGTWTQLHPASSPPARWGGGIAFDPELGKVVLYGGCDGSGSNCAGGAMGDTWEYSAGNWSELGPALGPPPRIAMGMVYSGLSSSVLMFGGWSGSAYLNDTWQFGSGRWTPVSTSGAPVARDQLSLAYDEQQRVVVTYGGWNFNSLGDLNLFSGSAWSVLDENPQPATGGLGAFAYDPILGADVLFGGWDEATNAVYNWTWTFTGAGWTETSPTVAPAAGYGGGFAFDPSSNGMLLFGGVDSSDVLSNATWILGSGNGLQASLDPPILVENAGTYGSGILNLTNPSSVAIPWSLAASAPWLSTTQQNGTVPPYSSIYVRLIANASQLTPGLYTTPVAVSTPTATTLDSPTVSSSSVTLDLRVVSSTQEGYGPTKTTVDARVQIGPDDLNPSLYDAVLTVAPSASDTWILLSNDEARVDLGEFLSAVTSAGFQASVGTTTNPTEATAWQEHTPGGLFPTTPVEELDALLDVPDAWAFGDSVSIVLGSETVEHATLFSGAKLAADYVSPTAGSSPTGVVVNLVDGVWTDLTTSAECLYLPSTSFASSCTGSGATSVTEERSDNAHRWSVSYAPTFMVGYGQEIRLAVSNLSIGPSLPSSIEVPSFSFQDSLVVGSLVSLLGGPLTTVAASFSSGFTLDRACILVWCWGNLDSGLQPVMDPITPFVVVGGDGAEVEEMSFNSSARALTIELVGSNVTGGSSALETLWVPRAYNPAEDQTVPVSQAGVGPLPVQVRESNDGDFVNFSVDGSGNVTVSMPALPPTFTVASAGGGLWVSGTGWAPYDELSLSFLNGSMWTALPGLGPRVEASESGVLVASARLAQGFNGSTMVRVGDAAGTTFVTSVTVLGWNSSGAGTPVGVPGAGEGIGSFSIVAGIGALAVAAAGIAIVVMRRRRHGRAR